MCYVIVCELFCNILLIKKQTVLVQMFDIIVLCDIILDLIFLNVFFNNFLPSLSLFPFPFRSSVIHYLFFEIGKI